MPPPERVGSVKKEKKKPKTADLVKPHVEGVYLKKKTPEESKGDSQKKPSSEAKMKGEASSDDEAKEVELSDNKKMKRKHLVEATEEAGKRKRKKKEKKWVFDLPGQKRPTPSERDPSRIYYESLYKQVPGCELAQIWMMESGLLPRDEAKQVYEKTRGKPSTAALIADVAVETSVKREQLSRKKKEKKRTETKATVKKSRDHKDEG